jgi:hypothetical protein
MLSVNTNNTNIIAKNKDIASVGLVTAALLMVPLVAMQYTDEVVWTSFDFVFAAVLIGGTGLAFVTVKRLTGNIAYRGAAGLALLATFLLIWINGAVGIIGSEDNPANLLYFGVIAVEFLGVLAAGFRPRGMSFALFATALAVIMVPIIALIMIKPDITSKEALIDMIRVIVLNAFFAVLFTGSGLLFHQADAKSSKNPQLD